MKMIAPNQKKICIKCGDEKNLDQFEFRKDTQKYRNTCTTCSIEKAKDRYRKLHPEKVKIDPVQPKTEYNKMYYTENSDKIKIQQKKYRIKNKLKIRKYNNELEKIKRRTDPAFRLRKDLSRVIQVALKENGGSKHNFSVMKFLPYSIQQLKEHIEQQFEVWMTWDNHGKHTHNYADNDPTTWTWNIDHIIPQSKLPYVSMEDDNFQKCWELSNLRPLKSIDNIRKHNKIL